MNLPSIVLLLQMCLSLLSNRNLTSAQRDFVVQATQVAQAALAQSQAPQSIAQAQAPIQVQAPIAVAVPIVPYIPPPLLQYNGVNYAPTQANQDLLNKIQQTKNACIIDHNNTENQIASLRKEADIWEAGEKYIPVDAQEDEKKILKLQSDDAPGQAYCQTIIQGYANSLTK